MIGCATVLATSRLCVAREARSTMMLLKVCAGIDWLNERISKLVYWLVLGAVLVSSGNAISRYALNASSNAWLELQWYMFSTIFFLCAAYTLRCNEHIRIDIVASRLSQRTRDWIDICGHMLFLLPLCVLMLYEAWPYFVVSWVNNEVSANAGGLIRWPARLLIVIRSEEHTSELQSHSEISYAVFC